MSLATIPRLTQLVDRFLNERLVSRIWDRDPGAWGAAAGSADERSIRTRLGWLDVATTMAPEVPRAAHLAQQITAERFDAVYLLGMGGSSLCAEVLRRVCGIANGHPELYVLDTTDERTIAARAARLDPARTLFLVSSKSGGTVEVASLERFFWARDRRDGGQRRGTALRRHYGSGNGPPDACRIQGLPRGVPEPRRHRRALLGALALRARAGGPHRRRRRRSPRGRAAMAEGCRQENHTNAGLVLGAFIGAAALEGRDKLTLALPPSLASLGLWIEQLVAESTGKHGKGALPVVDEPLGRPDEYGNDRAFVAISSERDAPDEARLAALEAAGHPVLRLSTRIDGLGAEFFRWEFATAVAGAALGINPFDEPNVSEAKEKTKALLGTFASSRRLPEATPTASSAGISAFSPGFTGNSPAAVVRAALASLAPGDYVAFLSYLPATSDVEATIGEIRQGSARGITWPAHSASAPGISTRRVSITRAVRIPRSPSSSQPMMRRARRFPRRGIRSRC